MSKDITSKLLEEDKEIEDFSRAVFVDTDLDTHLVIPVSSLFNVHSLKREICAEHFKFFPEYGLITVKSVLVNFHNKYYHLPDSMLLKTVFHGMGDTWFVFADVLSSAMLNHPFTINQVEPFRDLKGIEPSTKPQYESQHVHSMGDHPNKPNEGYHHSCLVHPSQELLEDSENAVKISKEKGNNTNVVETLNKEREIVNIKLPINSEVTRKRKKSEIDGQLNKEKDIKEDNGIIESNKTSKKRKTNENKQEILSSQHEQLNSHDKEKKIEEDVAPLKSREISKKRKNKRDKNFGVKNLEFSSERQNDDQNVDSKHTMSGMLNETRNEVLVSERDPLLSPLKEKLDEVNKEMGPPLTVNLESDKLKKKSKKKKSVSLVDDFGSQLNPQLNETTKEAIALEKVEHTDRKTNYDSLNVIEGVKEDVSSKLEETTKKPKNSKGKSSSSYFHDLSSKIKNVDQNGSDALNSLEELPIQDAINRPKKDVETNSGESKKSRNKNDPTKSHFEVQPNKEVREMSASIGVIQSDESTKRSPKKQLFLSKDISSLPENQLNLDEKMVEMDTPKIVVEQADFNTNYESLKIVERVKELKDDISSKSKSTIKKTKNKKGKRSEDIANLPPNQQKLDETMLKMDTSKIVAQMEENLTNCDTIDSPLKSENIVKKGKTNEIEVERETKELVQNPNNVPKLLSQHESVNVVEKKNEIQEDFTLKSENTSKRRKNSEPKSSVLEIQEFSKNGKNDDLNEKYVNKPEENVETTSRKLKKSSKSKNNPQEVSSDFIRSNKHKTKKLDQASSIDTLNSGLKLVDLKKDKVNAKTNLGQKLVNELERNEYRPLTGGVSHDSVIEPGKVPSENFAMEMDSSKRVEQAEELLTENKSNDKQNKKEISLGQNGLFPFTQAPHLEVSPTLPETRLFKEPQAHNENSKRPDPPSSVDMSSNGPHSVQPKKTKGTTKTSLLQKSNEESESSKASSSRSGNEVRKIQQKEKTKIPSKKKEPINANPKRSSGIIGKETVNSLAQKKGLLTSKEAIFEDGSSSSSDNNDRNGERSNASSLSTTIAPDNSSSSDYSEGESKGVGQSKYGSPKGNGKSKVNSSAFKLESVLRSSSRYKNAKLIASQSQDESQLLDFVPDSQPDM